MSVMFMPPGPVTDYMQGLDVGDTQVAVAPFADTVEYIRPAIYEHEDGVQVVRGRKDLEAFFERRRGRPTRHVILWQGQVDTSIFGEGVMTRAEDGVTLRRFLFRAEIDQAGHIRRYIAALA